LGDSVCHTSVETTVSQPTFFPSVAQAGEERMFPDNDFLDLMDPYFAIGFAVQNDTRFKRTIVAAPECNCRSE
jgi:hypothetical protein